MDEHRLGRLASTGLAWLALWGMAGCGGDSGGGAGDPATIESLVAAVDRDRYVDDLTFVAAERAPGSAHHGAVRDLCATRLEALGFAVEREDYGTGVNVIGVRAGADRPDEWVLVSAHYDHIPGCAGADDNASGVAGALELARVLAVPHPRTLVVACWDEEERGLRGSSAYAQRLVAAGDAAKVVVSYVFEMIGYRSDAPGSQTIPPGLDLLFPAQVAAVAARDFRGDFLALIPDASAERHAARLVAHADGLGLFTANLVVPDAIKNSALASDLRRSDHAPFWFIDVPAMMLGDSANFRNPNYHCGAGPDAVSDLDHAFATQIIGATVGAVAESLREE